jgi:hypothetical protein
MNRYVIPAQLDHLAYVASNMARADIEEVAALGMGPYRALRDSFDRSAVSWTGMVDEMPVCVFGVCPVDILAGIGSPWLLGTEKIKKHAKTFLKLNREYVPKMLEMFPTLMNIVYARHVRAIAWLKWLGFRFDPEPIPVGVWGEDFYRFHMEK